MKKIIPIILLASALTAIWLNWHRFIPEPQATTVTDTVTIRDTTYLPQANDSVIVMWKTKVIKTIQDNNNDISLTDQHSDSNVSISIPITRKTYQDSSYYVSISGYEPCLDTIVVNSKTITRTITKETTKPSKLNVGISVGYDPINNNFGVMCGINYNIFNLK